LVVVLTRQLEVFTNIQPTLREYTRRAADAAVPLALPTRSSPDAVHCLRLHGTEDFARNHENAFVIDHTVPAMRTAINELLTLSSDRRQRMGQCARHAVSAFTFTFTRFAAAWSSFYPRVACQIEQRLTLPMVSSLF
jgi:hypothetical protein